MSWDTVVGVDWSGAKEAPAQRRGIWAAILVDGRVERLVSGTRDEIVAVVDAVEGSVLAGFDFSPSFPRWFVEHLGCSSVFELWELATKEGERWLKDCSWPFWGRKDKPKHADLAGRDLRGCESTMAARSTFQISGAGTVGTGSIRGMPHLAKLRAQDWSVWPFGSAGERTVVEVYPRAAKGSGRFGEPQPREAFLATISSVVLPDLSRGKAIASEDAFDAVVAALNMWQHREGLASIDRSCIDMLEGAIWPTQRLGVSALAG